MRSRQTTATAICLALALGGCQTATAPVGNSDEAYALSTRLAETIGRCWFADGDQRLAAYNYSPERNADQSRVLIVRRSDPTGLPALVIEPKGRATADIYGPLLATAEGNRLRTDIDRWAAGGTGCA
ncbi:MAG: hypothetical protein NUV72_10005 [Bauldia sp.]|nr:hypothetical protein [Bauldia sp.]